MKWLIFLLISILLSFNSIAANIHGSIYDMSFSKAFNSVVEINTTPNQRFLAVNGSYSFNVPKGNYKLLAYFRDNNDFMVASENVSIKDEGNYVLDLFLYPSFEENDVLFEEIDFYFDEPEFEQKKINLIPLILAFAAFIAVILFFLYVKKKSKKAVNYSSDLEKLLTLLENNHGRMTQKEIRKHFGMSEAKISLMVAELESLNKVKKIKQGRGNIVSLIK